MMTKMVSRTAGARAIKAVGQERRRLVRANPPHSQHADEASALLAAWKLIASALMSAVVLTGCNKGSDTAGTASNKVRVGYIGLTCEAPIFTAVEKGFF